MKLFSRILALAFLFVLFAHPAFATSLYTSDNPITGFDATTVNTLPTGWTAVNGTWSAQTTGALPGHTHTLTDTSNVSGDFAIYNTGSTAADMSVTLAGTVANVNGSNVATAGIIARSDSNFNNGYVCVNTSTNVALFKKVGGVLGGTPIASVSMGFSPVAGNVLLFRLETVGTTIRCRAWLSTMAEPSTWPISVTDASVTAAGYGGVWDQNFNVTGTNTVSDFNVDSLPAGTYINTLAPTAVGISGGNILVSGLFTGTAPTSFNVAVDGGSYVAAISPTIGASTWSFTMTAPASGYHSINVQEGNATTTTGAGIYNVTGSESIFVATPPSQTVGVTYAYTGTYTGSPAALDYEFDAAGYASTSCTIGGGSFSCNLVAPSAGTHTVSFRDHTNTSVFGTSGNFTTSVSTVVDPSNAAFAYSPYNWNNQTGVAITINAGAYFQIMFTGNTATLNFDVSNMVSPTSQAYYQIDNGPLTQFDLASTVPMTIPPLTLGNADISYHTLQVIFKALTFNANRWNAAGSTGAMKFTGLSLDTGASVALPLTSTCNILWFGDSITEGVRTIGQAAASVNDQDDSTVAASYVMRKLLGCEVGIVGFGAQGYVNPGLGNVPTFPNTINLLYQGVARTFSPVPNMIGIGQGANDGSNNTTSAATSSFNTIIADVGTAVPIMVWDSKMISGVQGTNIQNAIAASSNPAQFHFFPMTGVFNPTYGTDTLNLHPTGPNNVGQIAPKQATLFKPFLYPASGGGGAVAY